LHNFKYRSAVLDIKMSGFGNKIKSITIDGKDLSNAEIPATLKGRHQVLITLANNIVTGEIALKPDYTAPETPVAEYENGVLLWKKIKDAIEYEVYKNGKAVAKQVEANIKVAASEYAEYQVTAIDKNGMPSFASEPVQVIPPSAIQKIEVEDFANKAT